MDMKYFNRIIFVLMVLVLIIFLLFFANRKKPDQTIVTYETEIKQVKIQHPQSRGGIIVADTLLVHSNSKLISGNVDSDDWYLTSPPKGYSYRLGGLKVPYILSKAGNSDTIMVKRNNSTYRFLLVSK